MAIAAILTLAQGAEALAATTTIEIAQADSDPTDESGGGIGSTQGPGGIGSAGGSGGSGTHMPAPPDAHMPLGSSNTLNEFRAAPGVIPFDSNRQLREFRSLQDGLRR